jgi:hypothetical protein
MMKTLISSLALVATVVGGASTAAPARPIDPSIVRPCETSWPAPADTVERADAALVPTYGAEPTGYRADARLTITVAGVPRPVAAGIGIARDGSRIAAVSTAGCDGVLHVAAPEPIDVYLGQLFQEWDVRLTQQCIGETCDAEGVRIVLDGGEIDMCPGAISLEGGTTIELSVG